LTICVTVSLSERKLLIGVSYVFVDKCVCWLLPQLFCCTLKSIKILYICCWTFLSNTRTWFYVYIHCIQKIEVSIYCLIGISSKQILNWSSWLLLHNLSYPCVTKLQLIFTSKLHVLTGIGTPNNLRNTRSKVKFEDLENITVMNILV
jgi:hypothetical protein